MIGQNCIWLVLVVPVVLAAQSRPDTPTVARDYPTFLTPSLRYGLDTTVSPCMDFDRFANGGWRAAAVLPDSVERFGVFNATSHQTQLRIGALLDSARRVAATSTDAELRVLGMYYESCLRADSLPKMLDRVSMYQALRHDTSRASRCRRLVMHQLPDALGQAFVRTVLTPAVETKSQQIVEAIRTEVATRVTGLPFVSPEAKERTLASLQLMSFKVAKPTDTVDYSGLTLSPEGFEVNQKRMQEYTLKYRLVTHTGAQKAVWSNSQYNPNAHFNSATNSIEIPTFLFQWPFFDVATEDALSYAAAGVILGHEIIHGVTWKLGSEGEASVHRHAQVLVRQYSALAVMDGVYINGANTLNENLADLGGVLVAYDAWTKHARASAAPLIEGFTPEQRFFLHYARLWREKATRKYLQIQVMRDPHAPNSARINGVVMNVPAFAKAFGCKDGDPMAKPAQERAQIW